MRRIFISLAVALTLLGPRNALSQTANDFSPYVDGQGRISVPQDYRSWAYLGTWAVAGENEAAGFHIVYTQPETIEAFRRTGTFPDGAVLVKELFETESGDLTTGHVSWTGEAIGWFVMIKDSQDRFKESGLWGDGWGWALFNADDPDQTVTEDYEAECIACHEPVRNDDWIYLQGYPALLN